MKVMRFVKVMPGFQEYTNIEVIKSWRFQIENNLVHEYEGKGSKKETGKSVVFCQTPLRHFDHEFRNIEFAI